MALSRSRKIAVFSIITLCFSLAVTNATDITKTIRQPGMATTIVFLPQQPIATAKSYNHDPYLQIISPTTSKEVVAKVTLENETTITQYVSVQPTFQRLGLTQAGDTLSKKLSPGISSEFVFPLDTLPRRK
ncbi:MAG: hypothetical protein Q8O99_03780 [bacterium]|nr:hypothetical protein [bacterium]